MAGIPFPDRQRKTFCRGLTVPIEVLDFKALGICHLFFLDIVLMISCSPKDRRPSSFASRVTETAQDCLRRSPYPMIRNVSCEFHEGALILRGQLPSFYHKQLTQAMVAGLPGVSQVINLTEVVAGAR